MGKATRTAYGETIAKLIVEDSNIVVLDADLTKSTKTALAAKACPERHFNMGIAEGNMMSTAAGFAASGYTVFASTFAMFASGRAWEQIRNSICYPNLNVKVCATHSGIAVGEDGVSHQAIEDIALMRAIPKMEVYSPCDARETAAVIEYVSKTKTPCYVRLGRADVADVYAEDHEFTIGKVDVLHQGQKVALIATGLMVQAALEAKELLKADHIDATIVNVSCLKPLDKAGILQVLQGHQHIFTVEEHNVIGGLGSAVAEVATSEHPCLIHRIGMQDQFAESAPFGQLLVKYGLNGPDIAEAVKKVL